MRLSLVKTNSSHERSLALKLDTQRPRTTTVPVLRVNVPATSRGDEGDSRVSPVAHGRGDCHQSSTGDMGVRCYCTRGYGTRIPPWKIIVIRRFSVVIDIVIPCWEDLWVRSIESDKRVKSKSQGPVSRLLIGTTAVLG